MSKSKRTLFILIAVFLVPMLLAWIFYSDHITFGKKTTNYGELITPPMPIKDLNLTLIANNSDAKTNGNTIVSPRKWLMLLVVNDVCDDVCKNKLFYMRQIQRASGKDQDRVARGIIYLAKAKDISAVQQQFPQMLYAHANCPDLKPNQSGGMIFLVDPLGNVMMRYNADAQPNGIFKDLQKLLRVSQIG